MATIRDHFSEKDWEYMKCGLSSMADSLPPEAASHPIHRRMREMIALCDAEGDVARGFSLLALEAVFGNPATARKMIDILVSLADEATSIFPDPRRN